MMRALSAAYFAAHPDLSLAAIGHSSNEAAIDLEPFGVRARYLAAERHPALVARYHAANHAAFSPAFGDAALPGWVLTDLFLMPGAIGLFLCSARMIPETMRTQLDLHPDDETIGAAYFAAPTVIPGVLAGVSLISLVPGIHAGAWIKALTLKMLRAERLRGVAQWQNPSVRVHTRLGPLRLAGRVPGSHELGARSFVYENDLGDDARLAEAMDRRLAIAPTRRIPAGDLPALGALLDRAEAGETILIVPPGLTEAGEILIHDTR